MSMNLFSHWHVKSFLHCLTLQGHWFSVSILCASASFVVVVVELLLEDNREVMLECCRVLGNLSRYSAVRRILMEKRGEGERERIPV